MLLYLFITCFSFLFLKSLSLNPLPSWATEVRLLPYWFWQDLFLFPCFGSIKDTLFKASNMSLKKVSISSSCGSKLGKPLNDLNENEERMPILDLPELALECILEKLHPEGLCNMALVCTSLRERCVSDHLWERHMKQKWGKIIGPAAYREWQYHIASSRQMGIYNKQGRPKGLMKLLSNFWPLPWMKSKDNNNNNNTYTMKNKNSLLVDSVMSWFLALETGEFWFPAQVYNRENGHVGFMLSCYDAELSYDPHTDTFQARYPPHGRRAIAIEKGIGWDRLRAPPLDTCPHSLHFSDCLNELTPGDHIEIQWRRNKEFPYGWWYGVVGHLESCDGNENYCRCHKNERVVLEFHQYSRGSRWRSTVVNRKNHREEGNEADGFYGGIRKLTSISEISTWKQLWPSDFLE